MGYSKYVGRVGALAVALGVGFGVAQGPVALASPAEDATASDTGTPGLAGGATVGGATPDTMNAGNLGGTGDAGSDAQDGDDHDGENGADGQTPSGSTEEVAPGVTVSSSGGAHTSNTGKKKKKATESSAPKAATKTSRPAPAARVTAQSSTHSTTSTSSTSSTSSTASASTPAATTTATVSQSTPAATGSALAATATTTAVAAPMSLAATMLNAFTQSVLGTGSGGPVESPLSWVVLAAARRFGTATDDGAAARTTAQLTTMQTADTQAVAAAAAPNLAPSIGPTQFGTPSPVTGAVTGKIIATDPENKTLTYAVTVNPTEGSLVFDKKTGVFTYTPTAAQRVRAQVSSGADTIAFTATVSDGVTANLTTVPVIVTVNPTQIADVGEIPTGAATSAVAVTDTRAYVANFGSKTISVIDTINRVKITDIPMSEAPIAVAVTPDGSKVYVVNYQSSAITVIDGTTNQLLAPIDFGANRYAFDLTVSPDGKTLYAVGSLVNPNTGMGEGVVTKVSTATGKIAGTVKLTGADGTFFSELTVTPDGKKAYLIAAPVDGSASKIYTFTSSSTTAKAVTGLDEPTAIAVSPDSTRVYVAGSGTIKVLDTKTNLVTATFTTGDISVLEVSSDGSLLMVGNYTANTISVYDTRTPAYTLVTTVPTNAVANDAWRSFGTVSPDGQELYFTSDGALQVISLVPANIKPVVGVATSGAADANGAVTGTVGVTDANNDVLTYTVSPSTKGSLVIAPNGTFTYTPTAAARHAAATTGAGTSLTTDTFTVTVSDGRRGIVSRTITLNILPANQDPTVKFTAPAASSTTGIIKGTVTGTDKDKDVLTYTSTGTFSAKGGTVAVDAKGKYTYTPTASARYYASLATATAADKLDTFTVTVTDGHGGVIDQIVTVKVSPKSTRPNNVVTSTGTTPYTEQQGAKVVDGALTLSDIESPTFSGATATLSGPQTGDTLTFTAPAGSGITGGYNTATGVLTLSGTSSVANYQTALRSVTFTSTTDAPAVSKTVSFEVTAGAVPSAAAIKTISITAINDLPALTTSGGATTYTEQQGGKVVDGAVSINDPDSSTFSGATATLSTPQTGDALTFTAPTGSGIKGTYNAATGVLTLTGTSSVANYQTALRSVTFTSTTDTPSASKTVAFTVTDSGTPSTATTKTISITAVNDAPILGGGGNVTVVPGVPVKVVPTITVGDADGGNLTGATVTITGGRQNGADVLDLSPNAQNGITGSYNAATGVLTLTGTSSVANYQTALRSVTFNNTSGTPTEADRTLAVTVTDGASSSSPLTLTATLKINHTPVANNDTFTGLEDKVFTGNVLTNDTDSDGDTKTATLGTGVTHGALNLNTNGSFTYTPDLNYNGTDTFTYRTSDGFVLSNAATVTITITPVDDVLFKFNYGTGSQYWTDDAKASLEAAAKEASKNIATTTPVTMTYNVIGVYDPNSTAVATGRSLFNFTGNGFQNAFQKKITSANHPDANGAAADGEMTVNFAYSLSFDDTPASNQLDFQSVAIHELLHSFGFNSMLSVPGSSNRYWFTYDDFIVDQNNVEVIDDNTYVFNTAYNSNLSGGNGGLYFNGANAVAANNGQLVPLDALYESHLRREIFQGAKYAIMSPFAPAYGTKYRIISTLEIAMLKDMGYNMAGLPPTQALGLASADKMHSKALGDDETAALLASAALTPTATGSQGGRDRLIQFEMPGALMTWYFFQQPSTVT